MSDLDVFGPALIDTELGFALENTLRKWFPTYLALLARTLPDIDFLPEPGAYVHSSDPNHFPEEAPPAVLISVPGTTGQPMRDAKDWRAMWDVRIVVFVTANTRELTEHLAKYYATATRMIMVQKPSLGEFAEGVSWRGVAYSTRVADRDQRTLGSSENRFAVDVRDVVRAFVGPLEPITTVPPAWPRATSVSVTTTPQAS